MRKLTLAALLVLPVLLSPAASATRAVPVEGDLRVEHLEFEGEGLVQSPSASIELVDDLTRPSDTDFGHGRPTALPLEIAWSGASGWQVERRHSGVSLDNTTAYYGKEGSNETLSWRSGRLTQLTCHAPCDVLLFPLDGSGGPLGVRGHLSGEAGWARADTVHWAGEKSDSAADAFAYLSRRGDIVATGPGGREPHGIVIDSPTLIVPRDVGLFLWNVTGVVEEGGTRQTFDTRKDEQRDAVGGPAGTREKTWRFAVLRLSGAEVFGATAVRFSAPEAEVRFNGTLSAREASGRLTVGDDAHHLDTQALEITGDLALRLRTEGQHLPVLRVEMPLSQRALAARVQGDADAVAVGSRALVAPTVVAIALGAGFLGIAARAFAWIFYTRLKPRDILANPNRKAIHDTLARQPGQGVTTLSRATSIKRAVVRHHLRVLESHGLVTVRGDGRKRLLFLSGDAPAPAGLTARAALDDPTRRAVAAAFAGSAAPLTQRDVGASVGISPRLTSHHVRRLEETGLVTRLEGHPRRYAPTELLCHTPFERPERK